MEYPKPVIQVTDKPASRLPDTGGFGDWWIILIGGVFVMLGLSRRKRKAK